MNPEDQKEINALLAKAAGAPREERQKIMQQVQDLLTKAGLNISAPVGGQPGVRGGRGGRGGEGGGRQRGEFAGGEGGGRRGGGGFPGGANPLEMAPGGRRSAGSQGYTDEDRKNAKLPLPPEEDSQVQALLRPGLLADVEIIVEKIPDALHVPAQAVFVKEGKPTVFVQLANGKFEQRAVQLLKRSESTMVLAGGVKPNEVIAMMDPTADKSAKKSKNEKESSGGGNAMGALPGGGK